MSLIQFAISLSLRPRRELYRSAACENKRSRAGEDPSARCSAEPPGGTWSQDSTAPGTFFFVLSGFVYEWSTLKLMLHIGREKTSWIGGMLTSEMLFGSFWFWRHQNNRNPFVELPEASAVRRHGPKRTKTRTGDCLVTPIKTTPKYGTTWRADTEYAAARVPTIANTSEYTRYQGMPYSILWNFLQGVVCWGRGIRIVPSNHIRAASQAKKTNPMNAVTCFDRFSCTSRFPTGINLLRNTVQHVTAHTRFESSQVHKFWLEFLHETMSTPDVLWKYGGVEHTLPHGTIRIRRTSALSNKQLLCYCKSYPTLISGSLSPPKKVAPLGGLSGVG